MALIQAHFWSNALAKQTAFNAIVPDQGKGPFPVFYLLHGLSDDHTIWLRRTRIDSYVNDLPMIVVMPDNIAKAPGQGWATQIIMAIMLILNILFIVDFIKMHKDQAGKAQPRESIAESA